MKDPRSARTLEDAAKNPDGTYNGYAALSWLSEVVNPGRGIAAEEVKRIYSEVAQRAKAAKAAGGF